MKVCIDPGHGGVDSGAVGPGGLCEASVTQYAAKHLAAGLKAIGHQVTITQGGGGMQLKERAALSNEFKADLFISLHCNAAENPSAHGSETWYCKGSVAGEAWAKKIQAALVKAGGRHDRGIKAGAFAVLRHTIAPAVLVELAFISNPEEEKLLKSTEWVNRVLVGLAKAIGLQAV